MLSELAPKRLASVEPPVVRTRPVSTELDKGTTLAFEKFWTWLRGHPNCILRAGTDEVWLYDQEEFHWHLEEDGKRGAGLQLLAGKRVIAELLIDLRDVLFVQSSPEEVEEGGPKGATMFEIVVGNKEETYTAYHFVLAHPFEEEAPTGGTHSAGGFKH